MKKIYQDAKDLHVVSTFIYGQEGDSAAYTDYECTTEYKTSELEEVFLKGAVIAIDGDYFKPINFIVSEGVGTVTYVIADTTTATTAVLGTLSSVED